MYMSEICGEKTLKARTSTTKLTKVIIAKLHCSSSVLHVNCNLDVYVAQLNVGYEYFIQIQHKKVVGTQKNTVTKYQ